MAILTAAVLATTAAQAVIANEKRKKQEKEAKKRDKALEKEERKNSIARALGVGFTGTRRELPSGIANTGTLDTLSGLTNIAGTLASRKAGQASTGGGGEFQKAGPRPVADNSAITRQLRQNRQNSSGSFPIMNTNIG